MTEKDKILGFIDTHIGIFLDAISYQFPCSHEFIEKFQDLLNWDLVMDNNNLRFDFEFCKKFRNKIVWSKLSPGNTFIKPIENQYAYNSQFLEEFKNELSWREFIYNGSNELLSDEIIAKYEDRIAFFDLSCNSKKIFTENLILKYEDKWDWSRLSDCRNLPWSPEFILRYVDKWDWFYLQYNRGVTWTWELLDVVGDYLNPARLNHLEKLLIGIQNRPFEFYANNPFEKMQIISEVYSRDEFSKILMNFNPVKESMNIRIPWTTELIEYYKEEWDWKELSENKSIPFTEELIDRYVNYWFWGAEIPYGEKDEDGFQPVSIECGLSDNSAIHWTPVMIDKYKEKLLWRYFIYSEGIEWTIDLLMKYLPLIHLDCLHEVSKLCSDILFAHLDEKAISEILENRNDELVRYRTNQLHSNI